MRMRKEDSSTGITIFSKFLEEQRLAEAISFVEEQMKRLPFISMIYWLIG